MTSNCDLSVDPGDGERLQTRRDHLALHGLRGHHDGAPVVRAVEVVRTRDHGAPRVGRQHREVDQWGQQLHRIQRDSSGFKNEADLVVQAAGHRQRVWPGELVAAAGAVLEKQLGERGDDPKVVALRALDLHSVTQLDGVAQDDAESKLQLVVQRVHVRWVSHLEGVEDLGQGETQHIADVQQVLVPSAHCRVAVQVPDSWVDGDAERIDHLDIQPVHLQGGHRARGIREEDLGGVRRLGRAEAAEGLDLLRRPAQGVEASQRRGAGREHPEAKGGGDGEVAPAADGVAGPELEGHHIEGLLLGGGPCGVRRRDGLLRELPEAVAEEGHRGLTSKADGPTVVLGSDGRVENLQPEGVLLGLEQARLDGDVGGVARPLALHHGGCRLKPRVASDVRLAGAEDGTAGDHLAEGGELEAERGLHCHDGFRISGGSVVQRKGNHDVAQLLGVVISAREGIINLTHELAGHHRVLDAEAAHHGGEVGDLLELDVQEGRDGPTHTGRVVGPARILDVDHELVLIGSDLALHHSNGDHRLVRRDRHLGRADHRGNRRQVDEGRLQHRVVQEDAALLEDETRGSLDAEASSDLEVRDGLYLHQEAVLLPRQVGELIVDKGVDEGAHERGLVGGGREPVAGGARGVAELHEEDVGGGPGRGVGDADGCDQPVPLDPAPEALKVVVESEDVLGRQLGGGGLAGDGQVRVRAHDVSHPVPELVLQKVPLVAMRSDEPPAHRGARVKWHPQRKQNDLAADAPLRVGQHGAEAEDERPSCHRVSVHPEGSARAFSITCKKRDSVHCTIQDVACCRPRLQTETVLLGQVKCQGIECKDPKAVCSKLLEPRVAGKRHRRHIQYVGASGFRGLAQHHQGFVGGNSDAGSTVRHRAVVVRRQRLNSAARHEAEAARQPQADLRAGARGGTLRGEEDAEPVPTLTGAEQKRRECGTRETAQNRGVAVQAGAEVCEVGGGADLRQGGHGSEGSCASSGLERPDVAAVGALQREDGVVEEELDPDGAPSIHNSALPECVPARLPAELPVAIRHVVEADLAPALWHEALERQEVRCCRGCLEADEARRSLDLEASILPHMAPNRSSEDHPRIQRVALVAAEGMVFPIAGARDHGSHRRGHAVQQRSHRHNVRGMSFVLGIQLRSEVRGEEAAGWEPQVRKGDRVHHGVGDWVHGIKRQLHHVPLGVRGRRQGTRLASGRLASQGGEGAADELHLCDAGGDASLGQVPLREWPQEDPQDVVLLDWAAGLGAKHDVDLEREVVGQFLLGCTICTDLEAVNLVESGIRA
mmetsp:Transcript_110827/g.353158  ORF Transcript_110827/g.353158 Transcript_110827/m.353158 type:complete len:1285 (+) Transcript_110827:2214-6068(+)